MTSSVLLANFLLAKARPVLLVVVVVISAGHATSAETRSTEYTPLIRDSERITDLS